MDTVVAARPVAQFQSSGVVFQSSGESTAQINLLSLEVAKVSHGEWFPDDKPKTVPAN